MTACVLCACIFIILVHGESNSPVYIYIYIYIRMYICIYTQYLIWFQRNLCQCFAGLLPPRLDNIIILNKNLSSAAVVMLCVFVIFKWYSLIGQYLWILHIIILWFEDYNMLIKNFNNLVFLCCIALEILFLRLAMGSGYSNSRSLAPVMTPGFGSWHL